MRMATEVLRSTRARVSGWLGAPLPIAPLALFRVLFGLLMAAAVIRFWANGWIRTLYLEPAFHFSYPGFAWIKPLGFWPTHGLFAVMGMSALGILLGWRYRISAWVFFLSFTYAELMDKTNYLNHYYFVSLIAFLLLWTPAHASFSLDVLRRPAIRLTHVARWQAGIFKVQIGMVYFFAGLAKLNADWLLHAQPLALWLPAKSHLFLIGPLLDLKPTAYLFSWAGAAFDLSIVFFLLWRKTLPFAYAAVILFHAMTAWLFPGIGVFPWVMMVSAAIFLPPAFHARALAVLAGLFAKASFLRSANASRPNGSFHASSATSPATAAIASKSMPAWLAVFLAIQAILPLRHLFQPGELFWTERGYRFSWRVMLMEKAGNATFVVSDPRTGGRTEVSNCDYLTAVQEKMMATQPDMILEFARHIADDFARRGVPNPEVRVHSYVTVNGRGSRLYLDSTVNLAALPRGADPTQWLRPYPYDL
jgi:hypothetical protein